MKVNLHPTVWRIMLRDGINISFNMIATEPRWEAFAEDCYSVNEDANCAVLDCAWGVRKGLNGLIQL